MNEAASYSKPRTSTPPSRTQEPVAHVREPNNLGIYFKRFGIALLIGFALQALIWAAGLGQASQFFKSMPNAAVISDGLTLMLFDTLLIMVPGAILVGVGWHRRPRVLAWVGICFMIFGLAKTASLTML